MIKKLAILSLFATLSLPAFAARSENIFLSGKVEALDATTVTLTTREGSVKVLRKSCANEKNLAVGKVTTAHTTFTKVAELN